MKKLLTFLLIITPIAGFSQGITITVGEPTASDADKLNGKSAAFYVDTLNEQSIEGEKTFKDTLKLIKAIRYSDGSIQTTAPNTDHGALTGLLDDDHTQYQKETDFTSGSILFRGTTIIDQDNTNLFWDNTNNRLGIGTTVPVSDLHIVNGLKASSGEQVRWNIGTDDGVGTMELATRIFGGATGADRYVDIQSIEQGVGARALALQPSGGFVGIGTTIPEHPLTIKGSDTRPIDIRGTGTQTGFLFTDDDATGSGEFWQFIADLNGTDVFRINHQNTSGNFFDVLKITHTGADAGTFEIQEGDFKVTSGSVLLGTNTAATGIIRLPNASPIKWRNAANNGDINSFTVNASNDIILGAASGGWNAVRIANDGSLKLGFFAVTPATRAGTTSDIKDALTNYGLLQGTSATPLNLDGGDLTGDNIIGTAAGGGSVAAIRAVSTGPGIEIRQTGASVDEKSWDFLAGGGQLSFRTVNDANNAANIWMLIDRTGIIIDLVTFPSRITSTATFQAFTAVINGSGGFQTVTFPTAFPSGSTVIVVGNMVSGNADALIIIENGSTTNTSFKFRARNSSAQHSVHTGGQTVNFIAMVQ